MSCLLSYRKNDINNSGFTIVELLVVIVVIGVLAAISIVSYTGISQRAKIASLQSDLSGAATQIKLFNVENDIYPATISTDCVTSPTTTTNLCLRVSDGNDYTTTSYIRPTPQSFVLTATNGDLAYYITESTPPQLAVAATGNSFIMAWDLNYNDDIGRSIIQTSDGGYAITGESGSDMFIAKYDSENNLSWSKTWGGAGAHPGYSGGLSIIQTSDGGYAITGSSVCSSTDYSGDMFLVKYDSAGNLSWSKTWATGVYGSSEIGTSVVQASDGGYVIAGYIYIYSGPGSSYDVIIVKYDSAGTLLWNKTWGDNGSDDLANSITRTSDNGYAITGRTYFGYSSNDMYNMFLVKYDSAGTLLWDRTLVGTDAAEGKSIIQTTDNGYVITGSTFNYGGNEDMFIAKYDSSGDLSWSKIWGGVEYESGNSVDQTSDGGYIVTGRTDSFGAGGDDMFIAKYDSAGTLLWSRTWGGESTDTGNSIVQTSDGGYAVTGVTASYGSGGGDMLITKYNSMGMVDLCYSPMCQSPTVTVSNLIPNISDPTAISMAPSAVSSSLSVVDVDITALTTSTLIAPIIPPPPMTITFSGQELYAAYPGESQTVCKQWTVPEGNTIKGFIVSQETEFEYDFFTVSSDGVEKYNQSGSVVDSYVDLSSSPGTTLSACMITDEVAQQGYGGEVTGVLYN